MNKSSLMQMPVASNLQQQINELVYRNDFFRFLTHRIRTFEQFKGKRMTASRLSDDPDIMQLIPALVKIYNLSHRAEDPVFGYNQIEEEEVGSVIQQARDYDELCMDNQIRYV